MRPTRSWPRGRRHGSLLYIHRLYADFCEVVGGPHREPNHDWVFRLAFFRLYFTTPLRGAVRPHRTQAAADLLWRRRNPGDRTHPADSAIDPFAGGRLAADLCRVDLRCGLHFDKRYCEGRTVPDQRTRDGRGFTLCDHGLSVRRNRARRRALVQEPGSRAVVLLLSCGNYLPVATHLYRHARYQA